MTVDAVRAGYRVREYELDLEHRATGREPARGSPTAAASSPTSAGRFWPSSGRRKGVIANSTISGASSGSSAHAAGGDLVLDHRPDPAADDS